MSKRNKDRGEEAAGQPDVPPEQAEDKTPKAMVAELVSLIPARQHLGHLDEAGRDMLLMIRGKLQELEAAL